MIVGLEVIAIIDYFVWVTPITDDDIPWDLAGAFEIEPQLDSFWDALRHAYNRLMEVAPRAP